MLIADADSDLGRKWLLEHRWSQGTHTQGEVERIGTEKYFTLLIVFTLTQCTCITPFILIKSQTNFTDQLQLTDQ